MADRNRQKAPERAALTATTFVEIADTLVGDFDVIDVLTVLSSRSVELLSASAAGILLADTEGRFRVIGSSTEEIQLLELFQIQSDEGPCLDCFRQGVVIQSASLAKESPWPRFATESVRAGFPSVCAVPLRLKNRILGCLNLFMTEPVLLSEAEVALAQALADVASIVIVQDQVTRQAAVREEQLQHALNSRVAIEQAKGMIAEHAGLDMDESFGRLRAHARANNLRLTDLAESIVAGSVPVTSVVARGPSHGRPPR